MEQIETPDRKDDLPSEPTIVVNAPYQLADVTIFWPKSGVHT